MKIQIDRDYPVKQIQLVIENNACCSIWFQIAATAPIVKRSQSSQWRQNGQQGEISGQDCVIPFTVIGYQSNDDDESLAIRATPLSLPMWDWFSERPSSRTPWSIYQRQDSATDPTAWQFVRRMFGYHISEPEGDFAERVCQALTEHACFPRRAGWSNQDFLERMIGELDERVPHAMGWSAFQREQPILLVTDSGAPVALDESWLSSDPGHDSTRAGRDFRYDKLRLKCEFHPRNPFQMCKTLATRGRTGISSDFGDVPDAESGQIVPAPGNVQYQGKNYFCRRAIYTFLADADFVKAELEFGLKTSRSPGWPSCKLDCTFQDWVTGESGVPDRIAVKPQGTRCVVVDRDLNPNPNASLWAEVLMPVATRDNFGGLYCTYRLDDAMKVLIEPGETPDLRGHPQHRQSALEVNDVTLNAPKVGIQTSATNAGGTEGARYDGPGNKVVIQTNSGDNSLTLDGPEQAKFSQNVSIERQLFVKE